MSGDEDAATAAGVALMDRVRALDRRGALDLPLPGHGRTPERHLALAEFGREDLSLARLIEGHLDAVAILHEAGRTPQPGAIYGVWASEAPGRVLTLSPDDGHLLLNGVKQYCSGGTLVDFALVTSWREGRVVLVEIELASPGIRTMPSSWKAEAFAGTCTCNLEFANVAVRESSLVGRPGFYLERPGFWHGALGPASCWAGGAMGLVDAAFRSHRKDPHATAQIGGLAATRWGLQALLSEAGRSIDGHPESFGQGTALMVRHLVERAATDVLDRFGRATGPALLAFDAAVARRHAELTLYIRQCHAERDLEAIGRLIVRERDAKAGEERIERDES